MTRYRNVLSINHRGKGIIYGGGQRSDGTANHGFRNLKGDPTLVAAIHEVKSDPALRALLSAIAQRSNGLFTVGCESGDVAEKEGHRRFGYLEFAINSKAGVSDAANYFPLFFHFDHFLHQNQFDHAVQFHWELEGARFMDWCWSCC